MSVFNTKILSYNENYLNKELEDIDIKNLKPLFDGVVIDNKVNKDEAISSLEIAISYYFCDGTPFIKTEDSINKVASAINSLFRDMKNDSQGNKDCQRFCSTLKISKYDTALDIISLYDDKDIKLRIRELFPKFEDTIKEIDQELQNIETTFNKFHNQRQIYTYLNELKRLSIRVIEYADFFINKNIEYNSEEIIFAFNGNSNKSAFFNEFSFF